MEVPGSGRSTGGRSLFSIQLFPKTRPMYQVNFNRFLNKFHIFLFNMFQMPLETTIECLMMRENRVGIDLVRDLVEEQLHKVKIFHIRGVNH